MQQIGENILRGVTVTNELSTGCLKCDGGTGWEYVEGKGVRQCECRKQEMLAKRLANSRIPVRYQTAEFDNFIANTPNLTRALMTSRRFVEEFPAECGLLFMGSCGVGKTHLACAALKGLIHRGYSGYFYDFGDLLKAIRESYNTTTGASEYQILKPVYDIDVLVLDELGASKPTEWVQETMTQIINTRYLNKKLTIFTTNYLDVVQPGGFDETLIGRIGVRLRSRLKEMGRQIAIEGEDYREQINKNRGLVRR